MKHDFNTPRGVRAVADHLDHLALDPDLGATNGRHHVGILRILPTHSALTRAALALRKNISRRDPHPYSAMETDVTKMDAVRHCGSPEAALETIRRQLDTQGESMESADVKRCERAARLIETYIEKTARDAAQALADEVEAAWVEAGTVPGNDEVTPTGTEVAVTHNCRQYLGTVTACKPGPHPILGSKHPTMLYAVRVDRIRETQGRRYAYFPMKAATLKKVIPSGIKILAPDL